ncbi:MAG: hypothetical protein KJO76_07875 [Gammaproteobacteria bacterium]|nr:hypothetical protein [Gammaproteobacteria bacterium]
MNSKTHNRRGHSGVVRVFLTGILCLFLAACSTTRFAYNQLDWIVVWYLNGYFSLDETQEAELRDAVQRNLEWHRRSQLPKYAAFARQVDRDIAGPMTTDLLEQRLDEATGFLDAALRYMLPDVSAFFLMLSDEQIDEFIANLEDDNKELWTDYGGETPEERLERRERAAFKGFKRVFGRLNVEQKTLIRTYMANMHDVSEYWIESRRRWQVDFRDLMIERPPEPEFSERLTALMIDPNRTDDPGYRDKVEENKSVFMEMTVALIGILTDKQRARFSDKMKSFARDFETLSIQES